MKLFLLSLSLFAFTKVSLAQTKWCIAYHRHMPDYGVESNAFDVKCNNKEFGVGAPVISIFKSEQYLIDHLAEEVKKETNLDLVASLEPVAGKSLSYDAKMVHLFVKKDPEVKKVYCTLLKMKGTKIGMNQNTEVKDAYAKCQWVAKRIKLPMVTDNEANEYMLDHGLDKEFEAPFKEQMIMTGQNGQRSETIAIYSKFLE